jgi:hypothetical protein
MSKTDRSTWKRFEQLVARFFGSERTPLSGGNDKRTRSDSLHPQLFIEAKYRGKSAICSLYREVAKLAVKEGKVPVVALKEKGKEGWLLVCHPLDIHLLSSLAKDYTNPKFLPDGKESQ